MGVCSSQASGNYNCVSIAYLAATLCSVDIQRQSPSYSDCVTVIQIGTGPLHFEFCSFLVWWCVVKHSTCEGTVTNQSSLLMTDCQGKQLCAECYIQKVLMQPCCKFQSVHTHFFLYISRVLSALCVTYKAYNILFLSHKLNLFLPQEFRCQLKGHVRVAN